MSFLFSLTNAYSPNNSILTYSPISLHLNHSSHLPDVILRWCLLFHALVWFYSHRSSLGIHRKAFASITGKHWPLGLLTKSVQTKTQRHASQNISGPAQDAKGIRLVTTLTRVPFPLSRLERMSRRQQHGVLWADILCSWYYPASWQGQTGVGGSRMFRITCCDPNHVQCYLDDVSGEVGKHCLQDTQLVANCSLILKT